MPIYDVHCPDCGRDSEVLSPGSAQALACPACGSRKVERLMSAPSALTGRKAAGLPGPGDHGCCGSRPGEAGCAGPGSCCGKAPLTGD